MIAMMMNQDERDALKDGDRCVWMRGGGTSGVTGRFSAWEPHGKGRRARFIADDGSLHLIAEKSLGRVPRVQR